MFFCFQEIDSKDAEEERKRSTQATKKASNRGLGATKAAKKPPQPRKNTKKAKNVEPENDSSSMEVGKSESAIHWFENK